MWNIKKYIFSTFLLFIFWGGEKAFKHLKTETGHRATVWSVSRGGKGLALRPYKKVFQKGPRHVCFFLHQVYYWKASLSREFYNVVVLYFGNTQHIKASEMQWLYTKRRLMWLLWDYFWSHYPNDNKDQLLLRRNLQKSETLKCEFNKRLRTWLY